jgi:hypothetical protein
MGTPYPRFGPPKLAKMRGIKEIPPRTPLTLEPRKPQNLAPLFTDLGGESKRKEPRRVQAYTPPNPKEKGLEIAPRKTPRKGSENHQKGEMGKTHRSLEEPR